MATGKAGPSERFWRIVSARMTQIDTFTVLSVGAWSLARQVAIAIGSA